MDQNSLVSNEDSYNIPDIKTYINIIPKESIRISKNIFDNDIHNMTLNETFSVTRETKGFLIENISSFFKNEEFVEFLKVKFFI